MQVLEKQIMDLRSVSLKQLRYFIATAETGQLSKAAHSTHVSQSAITAAIKSLESLMKVRQVVQKPIVCSGKKGAPPSTNVLRKTKTP